MTLVPPEPPLRDGEALLRPWTPSDVPAITAACQDPLIGLWTRVPFPYTDEDARQFVESSVQGWEEGALASFAIVEEDGSLLGSIAVRRTSPTVAMVGYWLERGARGRGIATSAVKLLSRWAFDDLGIERLELVTDPGNEPSQRVAERAGFTREGVLREYLEIKGRRRDCVMFSRLPRDPA